MPTSSSKFTMEKSAVLRAVCAALRAQFEASHARSRQTRAASADPETRAEDKYDTRATEENYLADGQARQAQGALDALTATESLGAARRPFGPGVAIGPGALVRVEFAGEESAWFFLGPAAGGLEVVIENVPVMVLTPDSPLGRQLLGRVAGEHLTAPPARIGEVL